jgi:uncharacterized protein
MSKEIEIIWKITNHCNFACRYCHYDDEMHLKPSTMDIELAELLIKKIGEGSSYQRVFFSFHGGECLLIGLDYFEKIISFQKQYLKGKTCKNFFQTNGSLINKELIRFAQKNQIGFSISLDGPKAVHDANRVYCNGDGTYDCIMRNISLLNTYEQEFSILSVYNELMTDSDEIFYFFNSLKGLNAIDFLPMRPTHELTFQKNFGNFLIDMYDKWFYDPQCQFDIRTLSMMIKGFLDIGVELCYFKESCLRCAIIEVDPFGNVYPCDGHIYNNHLLGNIKTDQIDDLTSSNHPIRRKLARLGIDNTQTCRFCNWYKQCHGGCPDLYDLTRGKNVYCSDYKKIFQHIKNALKSNMILDDQDKTIIKNIDMIPNKRLANTIKKQLLNDSLVI